MPRTPNRFNRERLREAPRCRSPPRALHDDPPLAAIFLPAPVEPAPALALYIRARDTAATLAGPVRELVSKVAPRVPIQELGSLEELTERSYAPQLWLARTAVFLATIGIVLAGAGVYAVSSYIVGMRSREFAIRMAVGASPRTIVQLVLGESARVAALGLLIGSSIALVSGRLLEARYYGVRGVDAAAFAGAAALFLAIMFVASAVPAMRAARVDPVRMLSDS
jgi:predicted lysophospholipase L1 biosynthesis ABC-type transport system permease subunit